MTLHRIGPMSCGKLSGLLYAVVGLIIGAFVSLAALIGSSMGAAMGDEPGAALIGGLFGLGAIILLPIFYGILGFFVGLIGAALYNLAARLVGGLELDLG